MLDQTGASRRQGPCITAKEGPLTEDTVRLASKYGRYGYRRVTAMLNREGWWVNGRYIQWQAMLTTSDTVNTLTLGRVRVYYHWIYHHFGHP